MMGCGSSKSVEPYSKQQYSHNPSYPRQGGVQFHGIHGPSNQAGYYTGPGGPVNDSNPDNNLLTGVVVGAAVGHMVYGNDGGGMGMIGGAMVGGAMMGDGGLPGAVF